MIFYLQKIKIDMIFLSTTNKIKHDIFIYRR